MMISNVSHTDFDDVLALNEASVPHVNSIDRDQVGWFADHAAFFRVARDGSELAGFLIGLRPGTTYQSLNYRWFCDRYNEFAYIDRVAVASWAQRRGLGETLYEQFAQSQRGVAMLTCEVNIRPPNEGSMRFHERMDFRQIATQETEGGSKEVALLLKTL